MCAFGEDVKGEMVLYDDDELLRIGKRARSWSGVFVMGQLQLAMESIGKACLLWFAYK
jgi:hypothetical protein